MSSSKMSTKARGKRPREQDSTGSTSEPPEAPQVLTTSRNAPAPPAAVSKLPELSDGGETITAFALARASPPKWRGAEIRNHCQLSDIIEEDIPQFRDYMNEIKFPRCILSNEFVESISSYDEQMLSNLDLSFTARPDYRRWASSLPADKTEDGDDDPYDLKRWGYTLHKSWSSHFMAIQESGNEAEIRNGTGNLFELAFQQQCKWKHRFREEREVFLPASPYVAKADILITMNLPMTWSAYLRSQDDSYIFASGKKLGDVVTFASEAKCNVPVAAQRQLIFDLCSAQHQQRALGFKNGQVFGATVVRETLNMYCSQWDKGDRENERVVVFPVTPNFRLDSFPAFIECFIFLCKVANHVGNETDEVFKEWATKDGRSKYEESSRKSQRAPWRLLVKPHRTTASSSSRLAGSGSSAQDAMDPLELEDWGDNGISVTPNKRQLVHGGDRLVQENLQAFDAYPGVELKGMSTFPAKDIVGWVRTLAEENHP